MSVDLIVPSTAGYPQWPMIPKSCFSAYRIWSRSDNGRPSHGLIPEPQTPSADPSRPTKRPRTGLASQSSTNKPNQDIFALPPGFQVPHINVIAASSAKTLQGNSETSKLPRSSTESVFRTETSLPSWHDRRMSLREPEEQDLAVSPLETPAGFLDHLAVSSCSLALNPLEDVEMMSSEGLGERREDNRSTFDQSVAFSSSYTLGRYLADSIESTPSQKPSIGRPDFLCSTAKIDIRKELQKLESDISYAFEGMSIANDGISEAHLQDLEASLSSEDLEGEDAESETELLDAIPEEDHGVLTLDGDEAIVAGIRDISPQLESWVSKSSLIVGRSLKPLVGSVVGETDVLGEEDMEIPIPHGRKRKASTCQ